MKSTTKEQAHLMHELQDEHLQNLDISGSLHLEFEKHEQRGIITSSKSKNK